MAEISVDSQANETVSNRAIDERRKEAEGKANLPAIDAQVRAIYAVPHGIFVQEAGRALAQFEGVASQFLSRLRQTEGNVGYLKQDYPEVFARFTAMLPTAEIVIGRLIGEDVDASAKMSFNGARKAFAACNRIAAGQDVVPSEGLRELQIAVDFLKVGLSMMQGY